MISYLYKHSINKKKKNLEIHSHYEDFILIILIILSETTVLVILAYINWYSENKLNHFLWNKKTLQCYFYVYVKNHPNDVFLYWKFLFFRSDINQHFTDCSFFINKEELWAVKAERRKLKFCKKKRIFQLYILK